MNLLGKIAAGERDREIPKGKNLSWINLDWG
jgi:hypothetical protein